MSKLTYLSTEDKKQLFKEFGGSEDNSGSVVAQVAMLTRRIEHLNEHLATHRKDHATRRSLVKMVGQRRRLQRYIARKDIFKYRDMMKQLGLRDSLKQV